MAGRHDHGVRRATPNLTQTLPRHCLSLARPAILPLLWRPRFKEDNVLKERSLQILPVSRVGKFVFVAPCQAIWLITER
jgi:hypothetical protein